MAPVAALSQLAFSHKKACILYLGLVDLHLSSLPAVSFSFCTSTGLLVLQLAVQLLYIHRRWGDGDRCNLRVHGQHTRSGNQQPTLAIHSLPLIIVVHSLLPSLPRCTSLPWRRKRFITRSETLENKEGRTGDAKFYEHAYTPAIYR